MPAFPKIKTVRDKRYLEEIRKKPCFLLSAECFGEVVPHHEGKHGMGLKASDLDSLPLCMGHHDLRHRKGPSVYGDIDIPAKIAEYQRQILGMVSPTTDGA